MTVSVSSPQQPQPNEKCPHSHLPLAFLKKIGKAVETTGEDAVKAAVTVALSNTGAFQE